MKYAIVCNIFAFILIISACIRSYQDKNVDTLLILASIWASASLIIASRFNHNKHNNHDN